MDILFDHIPRATAQSETFALAYGVEPESAVLAKFASGFQFDDRARFLSEVAPDKVVVVDFAEKADCLTVATLSIGQSRLYGKLPDTGFRHVADREHYV